MDKIKLLIVDNSDYSRRLISKMLDIDDFDIIGEAASAKQAIAILKEREVDIAIVDIIMPEVSGIELVEFITENFNETYSIMISSIKQENIIIDSISAGASDYIQKPIVQNQIIDSIRKIDLTRNEM